jgi:beta-barrel assembly-enhancing protease
MQWSSSTSYGQRVSARQAYPMRRSGFRIPPRLIIALFIALVSVIGYCSKATRNPITGRTQHIGLSSQEEIALGLQAAPEMIRQMGGASTDPRANALVDEVGQELVAAIPPEAGGYSYEFHLLADDRTVNAFALPGGQVFITEALFSRLQSRGQLAGVLGHEVGHVIGRHSADRMEKAKLAGGLAQAGGVASGSQAGMSVSSMVANMFVMKYGRDDELEADRLGIFLMSRAGYDPRSLIGVMEILRSASGGGNQPEFMSTHPDPGNRIEQIQRHIAETFPDGVPSDLVR